MSSRRTAKKSERLYVSNILLPLNQSDESIANAVVNRFIYAPLVSPALIAGKRTLANIEVEYMLVPDTTFYDSLFTYYQTIDTVNQLYQLPKAFINLCICITDSTNFEGNATGLQLKVNTIVSGNTTVRDENYHKTAAVFKTWPFIPGKDIVFTTTIPCTEKSFQPLRQKVKGSFTLESNQGLLCLANIIYPIWETAFSTEGQIPSPPPDIQWPALPLVNMTGDISYN